MQNKKKEITAKLFGIVERSTSFIPFLYGTLIFAQYYHGEVVKVRGQAMEERTLFHEEKSTRLSTVEAMRALNGESYEVAHGCAVAMFGYKARGITSSHLLDLQNAVFYAARAQAEESKEQFKTASREAAKITKGYLEWCAEAMHAYNRAVLLENRMDPEDLNRHWNTASEHHIQQAF